MHQMKYLTAITLGLLITACSPSHSDKDKAAAPSPASTPASTVVMASSVAANLPDIPNASTVAEATATVEQVKAQSTLTTKLAPPIPSSVQPAPAISIEPTGPNRSNELPATGCNQRSCQ